MRVERFLNTDNADKFYNLIDTIRELNKIEAEKKESEKGFDIFDGNFDFFSENN